MMKCFAGLVFSTILASSFSLAAQEAKVAPAEAARYLEIVRQEADLTGQFKVTKELAEAHTRAAEDATRANQPEKAGWESALGRTLTERANKLGAELAAMAKERAAMEERSKVSFPLLSTAMAGTGRSLTADETAYLNKVDALVMVLNAELSSLAETNRLLIMDLQTNRTPEDVVRVSTLADQVGRMQKEVERERTALELQKLQFRALRK
jgi:hypothetical protein